MVRAKAPLAWKERKALLSHWSPSVAKAIARTLYPDFRGTYEQHLWLLTLKAVEGASSSYAKEAKEKGILFLWPYDFVASSICGPSHYLYYVLRWDHAQVDALLCNNRRYSARLNAKYLIEALRLNTLYRALPLPPSRRFDDPEPPAPSVAAIKARKHARKLLYESVKVQMMLSAENSIEFKAIAYGWTHLRKQGRV